jgi:TPR repeat protein
VPDLDRGRESKSEPAGADQGLAGAQLYLGVCFEKGKGVPPDG